MFTYPTLSFYWVFTVGYECHWKMFVSHAADRTLFLYFECFCTACELLLLFEGVRYLSCSLINHGLGVTTQALSVIKERKKSYFSRAVLFSTFLVDSILFLLLSFWLTP